MEEYNPWWFGETHYVYDKWKSSEIKWIPHTINEFYSKPFSLNFIIGPRQVGKTTLIILYIQERLLTNVNPKSIFYYSCDELSNYRELGEIIDEYLSFRRENGIKRSYLFLDEITFVEDWWRTIKSRIDQGKFENDIIFISGSASLELFAGKERFPGRRGYGKDIYILPLSFNEFEKLIMNRLINESEFTLNIEEIIKPNKIFLKTLERDFSIYLNTGGFPLSILEYFTRGRSLEAEKSYLDWIRSDILKIGKSEKMAKEILSVIIKSRNTPLSWLEISRETGISSPNTVRTYIEALENLFVLKVLEHIEPSGRVSLRKNKKIHIIDPFLYRTISRWTRTQIYEENLVESIVASHLSRIGRTYYWRNASEIDIVLNIQNSLHGFEVKWGPKPRSKKRPIPTTILTKDKIPLFLSSIKWPSKFF